MEFKIGDRVRRPRIHDVTGVVEKLADSSRSLHLVRWDDGRESSWVDWRDLVKGVRDG